MQAPPAGPQPPAGPTPAGPVAPSEGAPPGDASVPVDDAAASVPSKEPLVQPESYKPAWRSTADSLDASDGSPSTLPRTLTVVHRGMPTAAAPPPEPAPTHRDRFFVSGYGGVDFRITTLSKKFATLFGVRGGLLLGKRMSIGGAMYRVSKRYGPPIIDPQGRPMTLKAQYGGLTVGGTLVRGRTVELAAQGLIGAGVGCISYNLSYGAKSYRCVESVKMMVVEPSVVMHIYPTRWMRLGIEGGYRAVARESWRPPNDFSMSGAYGGFSAEFGWFDRDD